MQRNRKYQNRNSMMKPIYLFLATGFQETEAIAPVTVCRKAGLVIKTVSITGNLMVESALGVTVKADMLFEEADFSDAAMLVMPGGMPGSTNLSDYAPLQEVIMQHYKAGTPLAAICAAPLVYGRLGLLRGVKATCYPGCEDEQWGAIIIDKAAVTDGQFITGHGPGAALDFGYAIVDYIAGPEVVKQVKAGMVWPY